MAEGMIQFLLSDNENAISLRKRHIFKIIPMMNPDGVIIGNYRCNYAGMDLNRKWDKTSAVSTPELQALHQVLKKIREESLQVSCYLDLHGHFNSVGIFGYSREPDGFFELLHCNSRYFNFGSCKFGVRKSKKSTGRVVNQGMFGIERSYCIESSFYCWA